MISPTFGFVLSLMGSLAVSLGGFWAQPLLAVTAPELPRHWVDTTYVAPSGRNIAVRAGGDFQAALKAAKPGDVITLEAGAVFSGPFTLPKKSGSEWIVIRTSAPDSSLPPPGTRIDHSYANVTPKLVAASGSVITTASGANYYRFIGIEIRPAKMGDPSIHSWLDRITGLLFKTAGSVEKRRNLLVNLVSLGSTETSVAQLPHHIIFDRCYIHGDPKDGARRGIAMNGKSIAVIDSYLSDFKEVGADSQAIGGWNGPGPFKIVNNYLEGAGENVMFGGGDPTIPDLVPSDIEIRHNHFFKPLSWKTDDPSYAGTPWTVKNLFELKNARRVLIEGNLFERNWWVHAYKGFAILFTVRNQDGGAPWSAVEDVTFTKNIIRHSYSGISITGTDDIHASQRAKRILIKDNLIDLDASNYGPDTGCNRMFMLLNIASPDPDMPGGILDLTIDHNTGRISGRCTSAVFMGDSTAAFNNHENFVFENNLVESGVSGSGSETTEGTGALTTYTKAGYNFVKNVLIGRSANLYPPGNFFPASRDEVGWANHATGDYRLHASSPYKKAGTDSKDPGVDFGALCAAVSGTSSTGDPRRLPEACASAGLGSGSPPSGSGAQVR